MRWISVVFVAVLAGGFLAWRARPASRLSRFGFPPLPLGHTTLETYHLGGFSTVYMAKVALLPAEFEAFAATFTWDKREIGRDPGMIQICTAEELDAKFAELGLEVGLELRENYPETFDWWTPQLIKGGVMFRQEANGVMRRAYLDRQNRIAYLFFQRS